MNEEKILNKAQVIMEDSSIVEAYNYLIKKKQGSDSVSGQYYNFLYCLAALSGNEDQALSHLEEAIIDKGYWYRTEVFEDEDLDSIRTDERFLKCFDLSEERFAAARKNAKTVNTWDKKECNQIAMVLHGNQQNISDSKRNWGFLSNEGYQVEYIQSAEIDSYGIFRWEDYGTGPSQLEDELSKISWNEYDTRVLCGFSAGCNTILRAILEKDIQCNHIVLQSPWIPIVEDRCSEIASLLKKKNIKATIFCGLLDEDCFSHSEKLCQALIDNNSNVDHEWIEGLLHAFPEDFESRVKKYLG